MRPESSSARLGRLPRLYGIADSDVLGGRGLPEAVEAMASAGIEWVQIRAKGVGGGRLAAWVEASLRRLEGSGTRLWINDRVDLASIYPVAGVHLGQEDLPPAEARGVLGPGPWIGRSTHGEAQLLRAAEDPAVDVVALGPVFATRSKAGAEAPLGLETLRRLCRRSAKPVVAIGGIDAGNLGEVLAAGAATAAVLGALCRGDVGSNCKRLLRAAEDRG